MNTLKKCGVCESANIEIVLETKPLPISTRYVSDPREKEYTTVLKFSLCLNCGVFQISNPVNYKQLVPKYDWIKYNEPEDHLDNVCKSIEEIMEPIKDLSFGGITYKDDSTLERLKNTGASQIWRIDPHKDLGIQKKMYNIESIQEKTQSFLLGALMETMK